MKWIRKRNKRLVPYGEKHLVFTKDGVYQLTKEGEKDMSSQPECPVFEAVVVEFPEKDVKGKPKGDPKILAELKVCGTSETQVRKRLLVECDQITKDNVDRVEVYSKRFT